MKKNGIKRFFPGILLLALFLLWTVAVKTVDVAQAGETATLVGFATLNSRFHSLTGVHMWIYDLTDLLSVIPLGVCALFGLLGALQLIRRKSLREVDRDILLLGIYYVVVIGAFFLFEVFPVNFRPIFIEGKLEASYPSSTTLLVLSVMPTLSFQVARRSGSAFLRVLVRVLVTLFTLAVVAARLVSGVHWLSDIIGAVLLSLGLFLLYRAAVASADWKTRPRGKHLYVPE